MASYSNLFLCIFAGVLLCLHSGNCSTDVVDLKGEAVFRSINLEWKARTVSTPPSGFLIKYCEDQAWGKHRCKQKAIDNTNSKIRQAPPVDNYIMYEATIDGLRLSTNYTVEVNPTINGELNPASQRARSLGGNLFIQTKGFYARAINCLANSSLVEIETGPYFGGKISVEGNTNDECSVQGDQTDPRSSYLLTIDHSVCESELQNTSVKTFIIVQENLPILTHSTRRFMVVCKYVPGTFTVRAGVNLPDYGDYPEEENSLVPVGNDVEEVDPSELFDSTNSLFNSRVAKQVGRALKFSSDNRQEDPQKWAHLVLMVVLIMSTVVGISCALFHFVRQSKARKNGRGLISSQTENEAPEDAGNMEAAVGNPTESQEDGSSSLSSLSPSTVTLVSVNDMQSTNVPFSKENFINMP